MIRRRNVQGHGRCDRGSRDGRGSGEAPAAAAEVGQVKRRGGGGSAGETTCADGWAAELERELSGRRGARWRKELQRRFFLESVASFSRFFL